MGGLDVGPKDHAEAPSKVICEGVPAARDVPDFLAGTNDVVHLHIIQAGPKKRCWQDALLI
jgi:hypothetical protein